MTGNICTTILSEINGCICTLYIYMELCLGVSEVVDSS